MGIMHAHTIQIMCLHLDLGISLVVDDLIHSQVYLTLLTVW